jgi:hypothetical protein
MKKISLFFLIASVCVLLPVWASAATVEGAIEGYNCVSQGKICPIDKLDPHIALERAFVVLTEGKDYYLITNVDRAILSKYIHMTVRVTGTIMPRYNSIMADSIEVFEKGAWKERWSAKMEYEQMHYGWPKT